MSEDRTISIHQALVANVLATWNNKETAACAGAGIDTTVSMAKNVLSVGTCNTHTNNYTTSQHDHCGNLSRSVSVSESRVSSPSSSSNEQSSRLQRCSNSTTHSHHHHHHSAPSCTSSSSSSNAHRVQLQSSANNRRTSVVQVPVALHTTPIQVVDKSKKYVNHSYNDFSTVLPEPDDDLAFYSDPLAAAMNELLFTQKLHHILSTRSSEFGKWARWLSHGRAFQILHAATFEKDVLPLYFGHKRFSTFLRQLDNHGFKRITQGPDRNCYYHECFLRGMPHLCKYMPQPRGARRKIPDPEHEPDLHKISQLFPLPGNSTSESVHEATTSAVGVVESASSYDFVAAAPRNSSRKRHMSPTTTLVPEDNVTVADEPPIKRMAVDTKSATTFEAVPSSYHSTPSGYVQKSLPLPVALESTTTREQLLAAHPSLLTLDASLSLILGWALSELQQTNKQQH